ncbi:hypothetical protein [Actinoallomurus sp. NPDC050550]|uniref:hypothetical protein n=1 Tax=Actinoallomurus sp. NPDC050550 TaxID=3154937 RepID=UPI0033E52B0D
MEDAGNQIDQRRIRYVTYHAESRSKEAAYNALFSIPRLEGMRSDWRIRETVECDPPLPRIKPVKRYERAIAIRIIGKIRRGDYKPGDIMPNRVVWAQRLGVARTTNLDGAIEVAKQAGYLGIRSRQHTYVLPPDGWKPLSEIPDYGEAEGGDN